jgi:hypothetical protein
MVGQARSTDALRGRQLLCHPLAQVFHVQSGVNRSEIPVAKELFLVLIRPATPQDEEDAYGLLSDVDELAQQAPLSYALLLPSPVSKLPELVGFQPIVRLPDSCSQFLDTIDDSGILTAVNVLPTERGYVHEHGESLS